MINFAIRMSIINNMRNPNSRLCYWHDTHFHIEVLFQTISVIILPLTTVNIIHRCCIDTDSITINITDSKYCYFGSSWCTRYTSVCVWLKVFGLELYLLSLVRDLVRIAYCMWIRYRTWLN